jgi:hypothetical protein
MAGVPPAVPIWRRLRPAPPYLRPRSIRPRLLARRGPAAVSKPVGNPIGPEPQKHVEHLDSEKDHPSNNSSAADAHREAQARLSISILIVARRPHADLVGCPSLSYAHERALPLRASHMTQEGN